MELNQVLDVLRGMAPEALAEPWDRVGLQIAGSDSAIERAMLCIDLTEAVLDEAIEASAQLVVAYHPPIFRPLKALTLDEPKQRIAVRAVRAGLAVYSPHTALDAATDGVNDWLAAGLGEGEIRPIRPAETEPESGRAGQGRVVELAQATTLDELADRVKRHLGVEHVQVAGDPKQPTQRVGLCAGAGGSLLGEAGNIDAFLTGEMRHHELLDARARGIAVILAGHSQTERPYLRVYQQRLAELTGKTVAWQISQTDAPPAQLR